jgi:protein TonB
MKTAFSPVALISALLLHAALVVTLLLGLSKGPHKPAKQLPIAVQLLPPPAENTPPAPLPMAATPSPPSPEEQKRPQPKRIVKPKPSVKPRETPAVSPVAKAPETPVETKPAPPPETSGLSAAPTVAAAPPTPPAPPAPPSPPVKTGVSISASYAATNRRPDYPTLSKRYDEQGTVMLQVLVKADGTAGEVKLKSSSGHPLLDKAAMSAVQSWRFNPATSDGKPIAEWYLVPIPFTLQN